MISAAATGVVGKENLSKEEVAKKAKVSAGGDRDDTLLTGPKVN